MVYDVVLDPLKLTRLSSAVGDILFKDAVIGCSDIIGMGVSNLDFVIRVASLSGWVIGTLWQIRIVWKVLERLEYGAVLEGVEVWDPEHIQMKPQMRNTLMTDQWDQIGSHGSMEDVRHDVII